MNSNKYYELYLSNDRIKEYVDKYCIKHNKKPIDAVKDVVVRNYIHYVEGK